MRNLAALQIGFRSFAVEVVLEQFGESDLHYLCLTVDGAVRGGISGSGSERRGMEAWLERFFDAAEREVGGEGASVLAGA